MPNSIGFLNVNLKDCISCAASQGTHPYKIFSNKSDYIIEYNPNTPDITFDAVMRLFLEDKLRSHVEYGSNPSSSLSDVFLPHFFSESEISQLCPSRLQQDILSFDIPMGNIKIIEQTSSLNNVFEYKHGLFLV